MTESLSTIEKNAAAAQGWQLLHIYDARGYFTHVIWPTAEHSSVWERAKTGDLVCRRALSIIAASELAGKSKAPKKGKK